MDSRVQYWLSTGLAVILLILVIANIWLYQSNVNRQAEVNFRQATIQQAAQLEGLYREMLQALASMSVAKGDNPGDKQIEQMLGTMGLKVSVANPTPAQQTPPATKQKPGDK